MGGRAGFLLSQERKGRLANPALLRKQEPRMGGRAGFLLSQEHK
jgi:hypothetical protein